MEIDTIETNEPSYGPSSPSTQQSDRTIVPASAAGDEIPDANGDDDHPGHPPTVASDGPSGDDHGTSSSDSAVIISKYRAHTLAVYRLPDEGRAAFKTLCEWLYYGRPQVPTNVAQCRIMIDTYLLATRYRAQDLPDLNTDGIREYHRTHTIRFEFIGYALDRHGEESNLRHGDAVDGASPGPLNDPMRCRIITHLVYQVAFAMNTDRMAYLATNGEYMEAFWLRTTFRPTVLHGAQARIERDKDPASSAGELQQEYFVAPRPVAPPTVAAGGRRAKTPRAR